MSLRSILTAALSTAAKVARVAGRAASTAGRAGAVAAVLVTKIVIDTVTGVARVVRELIAPTPPVSAAEAEANAYVEAAADPAVTNAATQIVQAYERDETPAYAACLRARYPEAAALQDHIRHITWGSELYPAVDLGPLPEHIRLWLDCLDAYERDIVARAGIVRFDRHMKAQHPRDLMQNLPPCYRGAEARAQVAERRERQVAELARKAGTIRPAAPGEDPVQEFLADLLEHAEAEAGPAPRPFR